MKTNHQRASGFTLIELMIVVAIMAVLASAALAPYQDYTRKAMVAEAFLLVDAGKKGVLEYYGRWGRLPPSNAAAGLFSPEAYRGRYVQSMEVKDGTIRIVVDLIQAGKQKNIYGMYFRPTVSGQSGLSMLAWECRQSDKDITKGFNVSATASVEFLPDKFQPRTCRSSPS